MLHPSIFEGDSITVFIAENQWFALLMSYCFFLASPIFSPQPKYSKYLYILWSWTKPKNNTPNRLPQYVENEQKRNPNESKIHKIG